MQIVGSKKNQVALQHLSKLQASSQYKFSTFNKCGKDFHHQFVKCTFNSKRSVLIRHPHTSKGKLLSAYSLATGWLAFYTKSYAPLNPIAMMFCTETRVSVKSTTSITSRAMLSIKVLTLTFHWQELEMRISVWTVWETV